MVKEIIRKYAGGDFVRNVGMVAGGAAFAQMLSIVVSPVLTRIYSPSDYGIYSAFNAVVNIFSVVIALNYQNAIPLAKDDQDALHLFTLSVGVLCLATAVLSGLLFFNADAVLGMLGGSELQSYRVWLIIGVFASGLYNIVLQYAYRMSSFRSVTKTRMIQGVSGNFIKVVFGLAGKTGYGLILGTIAVVSAGSTELLKIPQKAAKKTAYRPKLSRMAQLAGIYRQFPVFLTPNNCIYSLSMQLPSLMILQLFGRDAAGSYALANSMVSLPGSVVGTAIGQVFYARIAQYGMQDPVRLKQETLRMMRDMCVTGAFIFGGITVVSTWLFPFVFGKSWSQAGLFACILSVHSFAGFVISPMGRIGEVINAMHVGLVTNVVRTGVLFGLFQVAKAGHWSVTWTLGSYSVVSGIIYFLVIWITMVLLNLRIRQKRAAIRKEKNDCACFSKQGRDNRP